MMKVISALEAIMRVKNRISVQMSTIMCIHMHKIIVTTIIKRVFDIQRKMKGKHVSVIIFQYSFVGMCKR